MCIYEWLCAVMGTKCFTFLFYLFKKMFYLLEISMFNQ